MQISTSENRTNNADPIFSELKICFLNVCGIKQKLLCPEFIEMIKKYDICLFTETKLSDIDILNIPDDYMYYSKIRKKCKRKSGGIVVMYRNKLKGYLNFINTDCEFVQWVKISKLIINQKTDSLLGCVYIPPSNSKYSTSESFDEVENEMLNIKNIESLNCIIFGDFNAKTGSLPDYIIPDENLVDIFEFNSDEDILSYMFDYENLPRNSVPLHRVTSCNCAPNNYGHKLLNVCKRNNMYIANSRVGNDRGIGKKNL